MDFDLDLNREPLQSQSQSLSGESPAPFLVELEDSHRSIQERMRLLESVAARGRYLRPPLQSSSNRPDRTSPCKIDGGTHLLAEALAMDSSSCEESPPSTSTSPSPSTFRRKPGGSLFDCNICFSLAEDPVLTCCGHLFCWPCFYCLPKSDSYYSKECPVCEGEVLESDITPIYGGGCGNSPGPSLALASSSSDAPLAVKIPPRPRARRINSTRPRHGYPPHPRPPQSFSGVPPPWLGVGVAAVIPPPLPPNQPEAPVADAHSESPVIDRVEGGHPMVTRRSSAASRRARNDSGFPYRNQRRRGDWLGR